MAVGHDRDGAVLDAGRHRLEAGGLDAAHDLVRQRGGGDVDVAERLVQQRVAHRATDDARLLAVAVEHRQQARRRPLAQPGSIEPTRRRRHFGLGTVLPGTNLPFLSTCAGM